MLTTIAILSILAAMALVAIVHTVSQTYSSGGSTLTGQTLVSSDTETNSDYVLQPVQTAPPGSPDPLLHYLVGTGASGAWSGQDGKIANYSGSWSFATTAEIDIVLTRAAIQSFALWSNFDVTVTPYNGGSAATAITLSANQLRTCRNNTEAQALVSSDVTKVVLSSFTAGGTFSMRSLNDLTP